MRLRKRQLLRQPGDSRSRRRQQRDRIDITTPVDAASQDPSRDVGECHEGARTWIFQRRDVQCVPSIFQRGTTSIVHLEARSLANQYRPNALRDKRRMRPIAHVEIVDSTSGRCTGSVESTRARPPRRVGQHDRPIGIQHSDRVVASVEDRSQHAFTPNPIENNFTRCIFDQCTITVSTSPEPPKMCVAPEIQQLATDRRRGTRTVGGVARCVRS
jgi:hypothetical protein